MRHVKPNVFAGFVLAMLAGYGIADDQGAGICDLSEPWVREQVASLLLMHVKDTSALFVDLNSESPSVLVQLWLWAQIKGDSGVDSGLEPPVDPGLLIARGDDSINGLLWVIGRARAEIDASWLRETHLRQLGNWSKDFLQRNPRQMFLNLMVAGGVTGEKMLSRMELEAIDARIRDPDVAMFIGGRMIEEGDMIGAHAVILEAFESGSLSALLALGQLETMEFPECAERGRLYTKLYVSLIP